MLTLSNQTSRYKIERIGIETYSNLMPIWRPGPEVITLFSCSTLLSSKFQLLIKISTNEKVFCFMSLKCRVYHANANNCWHFNIYEQDKFRAQLSWAWKKLYNLRACLFRQSCKMLKKYILYITIPAKMGVFYNENTLNTIATSHAIVMMLRFSLLYSYAFRFRWAYVNAPITKNLRTVLLPCCHNCAGNLPNAYKQYKITDFIMRGFMRALVSSPAHFVCYLTVSSFIGTV